VAEIKYGVFVCRLCQRYEGPIVINVVENDDAEQNSVPVPFDFCVYWSTDHLRGWRDAPSDVVTVEFARGDLFHDGIPSQMKQMEAGG
jgi:hypothetical protein